MRYAKMWVSHTERIKDEKIMATLKELCNNVPTVILMEAATYEVTRRKNCAYLKRMGRLEGEQRVYTRCTTHRPQKGRVKNTASSEAAGTLGTMTCRIRTGNYTGVMCKSRKKY